MLSGHLTRVVKWRRFEARAHPATPTREFSAIAAGEHRGVGIGITTQGQESVADDLEQQQLAHLATLVGSIAGQLRSLLGYRMAPAKKGDEQRSELGIQQKNTSRRFYQTPEMRIVRVQWTLHFTTRSKDDPRAPRIA
jgi:hypothetical protein